MSKFSEGTTHSQLMDLETEAPILSFEGALDTQSFVVFKNHIIVSHHQFHKLPGRQPIEIFDLASRELVFGFGQEEQLNFPTSLSVFNDTLAVCANGLGFKSRLALFDISDPKRPAGIMNNELGDEIDRPTGLSLEDEGIFLTSYSKQQLWYIDVGSFEKSLLVDVSRFGQTTPMGILVTQDSVLVLGHLDGSLVAYDRRYWLPTYIKRTNLSLPWSVVCQADEIMVGNCGALELGKRPGFVSVFGLDGSARRVRPLGGVGTLQAKL